MRTIRCFVYLRTYNQADPRLNARGSRLAELEDLFLEMCWLLKRGNPGPSKWTKQGRAFGTPWCWQPQRSWALKCRKASKPWWSNDLTRVNNLKRRLHRAGSKATANVNAQAGMQAAQRAYKALVRAEKRKLVNLTPKSIDKAGQREGQQRTQAIFKWFKHAEGKGNAGG